MKGKEFIQGTGSDKKKTFMPTEVFIQQTLSLLSAAG